MRVVRKKRGPLQWIVSVLSAGSVWCIAYYTMSVTKQDLRTVSSQLLMKKKIALTTPRFDNVLLLGHFNYDTNVTLVQHWVQRWSEVFTHIHVRGPFSNLNELLELGITAFYVAPDRGFVSPMKTFADSLLLAAASNDTIVGVLYAHDDMLINITHLVHRGFPWNNTVMTQMPLKYYKTAVMCVYPTGDAVLPRDGKPRRPYKAHINNSDDKVFANWRWWKDEVLPGMRTLIADPGVARYRNLHGGFDLFGNAVSDIGYMPTQYAADFSHLANLFYKHDIFLEIGMPTIFATLATKLYPDSIATPVFAEYCTTLLQNEREDRHAPLTWAPKCLLANDGDQPLGRKTYYPKTEIATAPFSLYHPIKISASISLWNVLFDAIVWNQPQEALRLAATATAAKERMNHSSSSSSSSSTR